MSSDLLAHVIDDDDAMRDSLAFLLGAAGIDVRTYETANAFLAGVAGLDGSVIITDVRMPGMSGIELLQHLKTAGVTMPVIVITGHGDVPLAVEAMKLGAVDFLEKPFDDEVLLASVRSAAERRQAGESREAERQAIASRIDTLSARERQVLEGLVAGLPNKTIAYDLGISARTVEVYRANLMAKMQASSLSDLVRMAVLAALPGTAG
jgi:two-component system response regulator FixJ